MWGCWGVINANYHGEIGLLFSGDEENHVGSAGDALGHLLKLLHPMVKPQPPNTVRMTKDTGPSETKV